MTDNLTSFKPTYEENVTRQIDEMRDGCIDARAVPLLLVAIDVHRKGHMFWPDELPPEMTRALPALLEDLLDELREEPLS